MTFLAGIVEVVKLQDVVTCLILLLLHPMFQILESFHHFGFDLRLGLVQFVLKVPEDGVMSESMAYSSSVMRDRLLPLSLSMSSFSSWMAEPYS